MLTQNILTQERKLKIRWFVAVSTLPLLGVVTAFGIIPQGQTDLSTLKTTAQEISLPAAAQPASSSAAVFWRNEKMQRSETVAEFLNRLNVDDSAASNFLRTSPQAASFRQFAPGRSVQAETTADGSLLALRFTGSAGKQIVIEKIGTQFKTRSLPAQIEQRTFMRTGIIKGSLYAATDAAGLPDAVASQLSEVFAGDIDFHRDLKKGDKFSVVYEMTYSNGEPIRSGRILAAEFVNQGHPYRAVYFKTDGVHGDYYSPEGKSLRKAFLRSPVEFSRVSSGFSGARMHPVLNQIRAHKGVDYAAPVGTKVMSASDGTVTFVGWQNGFGNVIEIDHSGPYASRYGHLSRFATGLHRGQRVHQNDVIGFVGQTGLASAPHLHYEFLINGVQRDPLRVALPNATPISASQMTAFKEANRDLYARLGLLREISLAKLD
ncbi:MAG: peptidoglycan DD-metalloendopeptidase family protein [Nitrosomonadales bacterium]|nr:peptidoglycan DD-metalloendopeptidase family protein [Nitrosomonadales bacterium]